MKPNSISGITCEVADLERTAAFYELLGFRRGKEADARITFYVNWFFMTFTSSAGAAARPGDGMRVGIKVDSVDEFYSAATTAGLKPEGEPEKGIVGREFELRDPDGYLLLFFEK